MKLNDHKKEERKEQSLWNKLMARKDVVADHVKPWTTAACFESQMLAETGVFIRSIKDYIE